MRKSVGLLIAGILFITMMYTGTVCYGAERSGDDFMSAENSGAAARGINTQEGSVTLPYTITCGSVKVGVTIGLGYSWDEGYTGWFTVGGASQYYIQEGSGSIKNPTATVYIMGGTIKFDFELTVNDVYYTDSVVYTVDEYGTVH